MNKRQVIILWAIALLLGATVAAVKFGQQKATDTSTQRAAGQTLFENFPGNDVSAIGISGVKGTTHLAKKDGAWVVTDRDGYPAKTAAVNGFIRSLTDLKITRGMEAGPSLAPRFGMDESATSADEHGIVVTFKDASGKELAKVTLGKNVESGAKADPMSGGASGRFIRNHADSSGFYAVSEMFPDVSEVSSTWLVPDFLRIEKLKSISVSQPGRTDVEWKASRADENAAFIVEGAGAEAVLPADKNAALQSLLSYAAFEDLVPAAAVAGRLLPETTRKVTLETVEGFTYQLSISSAKPAESSPVNETVLLTVDVSATLPQERKKEEGEKPEDAKAKDAAFTTRLKSLTDKLEAEKKLAGHTYEITKDGVETLLLSRKDLLAAPPAAPAATRPGQGMPFPGGMTTPPMQVNPGN